MNPRLMLLVSAALVCCTAMPALGDTFEVRVGQGVVQ